MEKEEKIIGKAFIKLNDKDKGHWQDIISIDKSHVIEGIVAVRWRDSKGRRVTSFVKPENVNEL